VTGIVRIETLCRIQKQIQDESMLIQRGNFRKVVIRKFILSSYQTSNYIIGANLARNFNISHFRR